MLEGVAVHPLTLLVLRLEERVLPDNSDGDVRLKKVHVRQGLGDHPFAEHVVGCYQKTAVVVLDGPLAQRIAVFLCAGPKEIRELHGNIINSGSQISEKCQPKAISLESPCSSSCRCSR